MNIAEGSLCQHILTHYRGASLRELFVSSSRWGVVLPVDDTECIKEIKDALRLYELLR